MAVTISAPASAPRKAHRKKGPGGKIVLALVLAAVLASGSFLAMGLSGWKDMRDMVLTWTEIARIAETEDPDAPTEFMEYDTGTGEVKPVEASRQAALAADPDLLYKPINLKALREINPDVTGYIYIPNSKVNYPILKETEPEQYYYINHNMYRARDQYGSVFELCDEERGLPGNDNPVNWLFGHHMSSGSMFATLYNYESPDFYDNPIYIYRDDWRAEYEAIGYCLVDKNDWVYDFDAFERGGEEYAGLLDYLKENNKMQAEKDWPDKYGDLQVLSTCYGGSGTRFRMVLLCVERRRAMVPEYYDSVKDVLQYGGDADNPVDASTLPGYEQPDDGIGSMDDILSGQGGD